jgi:hypothetical protein
MKELLNAFNGGEISPLLAGRVDLPGLKRSCRILRNMVPGVTGGAFRRPPLLHVGMAGTDGARLIPFNASTGAAYQLELYASALRVWDTAGALVATLTAPWTVGQIYAVQFIQSNDVMWLVHPDVPVQELQRTVGGWTITAMPWAWPPLRTENLGATTITPSAMTGVGITLTASVALWEAGHVGSYWQISHFRDSSSVEVEAPLLPPASAYLSLFQQPIDGQQFAVNGQYYTFRTAVLAAYEVLIGATCDDTRDNIVDAIEATAGSAVYGPGTARNADVTAEDGGTTTGSASATGILTGNGTNSLCPSGTNVQVIVNGKKYRFEETNVDGGLDGADYNVKYGATEQASLQNLVAAINLTGTAGVTYSTATVINPDLTASLSASNQITLTAKTTGTAGNAITLAVNDSANATEPLSFSGATLFGGAATATCRVKLSARDLGEDGNGITLQASYVGTLTHDGTIPDNNSTVTVGAKTYTLKTALTPAANEVLIAGSADAAMLNLARAVNLTGTPGTDYGAATTINAESFAESTVTAANTIAIVSKSITGAAVALSASSVPNSHITASVATLAAVASAAVLSGGAEYDGESGWLRIKGAWTLTTLGRWQGTVYLEQRDAAGNAQVIRQLIGKLDTNRTISGTADDAVYLRVRVASVAGLESSDVPTPRFILEAVESIVHGLVQITAFGSSTSVTATVVSDLQSTDPTPNWREGAFSDVRGYPACVALHEERMIFAGHQSEPSKLWGSVAGDFRDFEETGLADGSWQWPFTSQQANPIRWLSSSRGLVIGTSGGERVWDSGEQGITPLNPPLQRQLTFNGSAAVIPATVGDVVLFVQAGGQCVLEYGYENASGSYIAPDLTQLVEHLTRDGIKAMAMQRAPFPVLWAVTNEGALLSCTYARREEVVGWAIHPVGGLVDSVSVCYGATGRADEVWIVVTRDGTRRIERLDPDHWTRLHAGGQLWHMDGAKVCAVVADVASGLSHLDGLTVKVLADGIQVADRAVIGGQVTVPGATEAIFGLANEAQLQPALFDFVTDTGSSVGRKFVCKKVHVRFYQTRECQYANTPGGETPYDVNMRDSVDDLEDAPPLFNGIRMVQVNGRFLDGVDVVFSASGIHPLNILNLVPEFELYGQ